jgi:hypothetical protein
VCRNNIKQLLVASLIYADENPEGSYTTDTRGKGKVRYDDDDDLSEFYPRVIPSLNSFVCPSTRNYIRQTLWRYDPQRRDWYLYDLSQYDHGVNDPGMSYECFGVMAWTVRKTANKVVVYQHENRMFDLQGIVPGPSRIWLILDGEKGLNRCNPGNHGGAGANAGSCDGHVEWIPKPRWDLTYELSQDEGEYGPPDGELAGP